MNPAAIPYRLDIAEICQEASERAGIEFRSGYSMTTARRSLEILQLEWANRGLNLWTIERIEFLLELDKQEYPLPADTIDLLDCVVRNWPGNQQVSTVQWNDRPLERLPLGDWPYVANKRMPGQPSQFLVRRVDPPELWLTPVPDRIGGRFVGYRLRYMAPLEPEADATLDMPVRLLPAMIAGLAYMMALKSKRAEAFQRVDMLKAMYDEAFELAAGEDRDRANCRLVPVVPFIGWYT